MVKIVAGESIEITLKPYGAENMEATTRKEILAAMVTYGFLTYHDGKVSIPNKELMLKFEAALEDECLM